MSSACVQLDDGADVAVGGHAGDAGAAAGGSSVPAARAEAVCPKLTSNGLKVTSSSTSMQGALHLAIAHNVHNLTQSLVRQPLVRRLVCEEVHAATMKGTVDMLHCSNGTTTAIG